tara:strand:- start:37 stop:522 length:486 start_codon:yes stop_codon:yes gene_type:complete
MSDEHQIPPATDDEIDGFLSFASESLKSLIDKEHIENAVEEMKQRKEYELKRKLNADKRKRFYEKNKEALAHNAFFGATTIKNIESLVAVLETRIMMIYDEIDSGKWHGESLGYAKGCYYELGNLLEFLPGSLGHAGAIKDNDQRTIGDWLGVELIEIEEE